MDLSEMKFTRHLISPETISWLEEIETGIVSAKTWSSKSFESTAKVASGAGK